MKLGRSRLTLETELGELTTRLAQLADHMVVAAQALDAHTVNDLSIEAYDVDKQIEDTAFLLSLIYETAK